MAASKPPIIALLLREDELLCPICRALVRNPVTTPCGHSFCMLCMERHWARSSVAFTCPQCRRSFVSKPVLQPNTVLCSIMEQVEKVWAEPELFIGDSGETGARCDVCEEGRRLPAVSTCVTCRASFCRVHLSPHTESRALRKHVLCSPVQDLEELQCKKHGRTLEMFCTRHRVALCWQCLPKHPNCRVRAVEEIRRQWKASIKPVADEAWDRADATDRALEALNALSEGVEAAAEKMMENMELSFQALRDTIGQVQDKVRAFVDAEKTCTLQRIKKQRKRLDDHMLVISETVNQLNECRTNDSYFNFTQSLPLVPAEISPLQEAKVQMDGRTVDRIILDLHQLKSRLESQLCSTLKRSNNPQYNDSCGVTFDPSTASASVLLSEDSSSLTVEHSGLLTWKDHQVNPELGFRVLCSQNFTRGQHYWEVRPPKNLRNNWAIGVTYENGSEHDRDLGRDQRSWCVIWRNVRKTSDKFEKRESTETTESEDGVSQRTENVTAGSAADAKVLHKLVHRSGQSSRRQKEKVVKHKDRKDPEVMGGHKGHVTTRQARENSEAVSGFFAFHNKEMHLISQNPPGNIGVHLDCDRGSLTFFTVSGSKVKLCYRFEALCWKPLCPAVWLRDPETTKNTKNAKTKNTTAAES